MQDKDIVSVSDHAVYYSVENKMFHFDFLGSLKKTCFLESSSCDMQINIKNYCHKLLEYTCNRFGDVFITENTTIGLKEMNLCEVKVFVPMLQDMNFGFKNLFINKKRINTSEICTYVHPFP